MLVPKKISFRVNDPLIFWKISFSNKRVYPITIIHDDIEYWMKVYLILYSGFVIKPFLNISFTNMINFAKPFQWISFLTAEKCFHDFTWNACWLKTKMHFKWPIRNRNLFGTVNIDSECKTLGSQLDHPI